MVTGSEPITQEKVEAKLKEYIVAKGKSDRIRLAVTVNKPKIKGPNGVVLMVSNPLQEDDVIAVKNEIRNYLKKELNNSEIQIETEIIQIKTAKRMYTDNDRFIYLCEKNPALGLLKQKFSLDFE